MSTSALDQDVVQKIMKEEWLFITLIVYIVGYGHNLQQLFLSRLRRAKKGTNNKCSGLLILAILTLLHFPIIICLSLELLKVFDFRIYPGVYYYIKGAILFMDTFQPVSLCLLFTSFAFSPVHAKFYAKLCYPVLFIVYVAGLVYEYNSESIASITGYSNKSVILSISVLFLCNILIAIITNYTVRNRFIKLMKFNVTSRRYLYMLCDEFKLTKWTDNLLKVTTILNVRHLCITLFKRSFALILFFLPQHIFVKMLPLCMLMNLLGCIVLIAPVTKPHVASELSDVLFNYRSRHLFNIYVTQTGVGNQQLFFLTDAAAYQKKVATATDISQLKDALIRLYYMWFVKTPIFPADIYKSITETTISLLSLLHSEGELQEYKKLFIRAMRDAEINISNYISRVLLKEYRSSRIGFMEYVYTVFFCLTQPFKGDNMVETFMLNVFSLNKDAMETKELIDTVLANPYTMMYIPDLIHLYLPGHKVEYVPSGDIRPPVEYKSQLFLKETYQQLLFLAVELLSSTSITPAQKKKIRLYIKDIFMQKIQHKFFVREQELNIETIHRFFNHLIGKRSIMSIRNPLLNRYDDKARKETMSINTYLSDLRSSVTRAEQSINNAVDTFLSGTFCAHDSITDDIGPLSYSLVRDSFSGDDVIRQSKTTQRIKVRGKYLAYPTPRVREQNHKIYEELPAGERAFLRSIIISRSAISSLEKFIVIINEDVFAQYPTSFFSQGSDDRRDLTTGIFFPTKVAKHFRDMGKHTIGSYWTKIILSGDGYSGRLETMDIEGNARLEKGSYLIRSNITNHKKLFRLLLSCIQHFELAHYKIPPQSLSDLCYRLTSDEASGSYYCSTRAILILRQLFLFISMLQKGFQGLLTDAQILGMLLAAACSTFNHITYTEDCVISSQQWLCGIYNDRFPIMNYISTSGWILIRESGVLANIPLSVRRAIRLVYISFLRSICRKSLNRNCIHLYSEIEKPIKKDAVCDLALRVCFVYAAMISHSDHLSNKSNALYLSLLNFVDHRREEQTLAYSLFTDESYLMQITSYMDVLPPTEYTKSVHILKPLIDLIERALTVIGNVLGVPIESWLSEINFINKDIHSNEKMWANMVLRK